MGFLATYITTVLRNGEPLIYNCPEDVMVYNIRITNNGQKNVHGAANLRTWAVLSFQEVQLAYPRDCSNFVSKYDCRHPESHVLINPDESARYYSSATNNNLKKSMIDSATSWSAKNKQAGEWMVIDLGNDTVVDALAIQGRMGTSNQWVTDYTVEYWLSDQTDADAQQVDNNSIFEVPGRINTNVGDYHIIEFDFEIEARYVRIVVQGWNNHPSMRAGVIQCLNKYTE